MEPNCQANLQKRLLSLVESKEQNKPVKKSQSPSKQKKDKNSLTIGYMTLQKMPQRIQKTLQQNFQNIIQLAVINCDLRTFDRFPKLPHLKYVIAARNSLRGSVQFLVKNRTIEYLDLSHNIISELKRLESLAFIKGVKLYMKYNPIDPGPNQKSSRMVENIEEQLKAYGVKYLDTPQILIEEVKQEKNSQNPFNIIFQAIDIKFINKQTQNEKKEKNPFEEQQKQGKKQIQKMLQKDTQQLKKQKQSCKRTLFKIRKSKQFMRSLSGKAYLKFKRLCNKYQLRQILTLQQAIKQQRPSSLSRKLRPGNNQSAQFDIMNEIQESQESKLDQQLDNYDDNDSQDCLKLADYFQEKFQKFEAENDLEHEFSDSQEMEMQ